MSWLNNSLSNIKTQLTTLAQEVIAETAGPGDAEFRGPDAKTALELLADTQQERDDMTKLCLERENENALLRRQIAELQNKISDTGGGNQSATAPAAAGGSSGASGRTSKSPSDNNANLEDSWCWEPENAKGENDRSSETSSGNGNEMVNIELEDVAPAKRERRPSPALERRVQQLEAENKQLNIAIEELDTQHSVAIQKVIEMKASLQEQLAQLTLDHDAMKKDSTAQQMRTAEELANLQALLDKKNEDNLELIERVKSSARETDKAMEEREELTQRVEQLLKEIEEVKKTKPKTTSESSQSSTEKQSEDEFIVVREGEGHSSSPTAPPTKEALKEKIVQLENRMSELTLENQSLVSKLHDREMEKELSANVLKENLRTLQTKCDEYEGELRSTRDQLEEEREKIESWKQKAAEAIIAQEEVKVLAENREKMEKEIAELKQDLQNSMELEKRLLFAEREKESLQIDLQNQRSAHERLIELETKVQRLTLENQQLQLNVEPEETSLAARLELQEKVKHLTEENSSLHADLESLTQKTEPKTEVTDLDADEEDAFNLDRLRDLLNAHIRNELEDNVEESVEKAYRVLKDRLCKIESLEKNLAEMSDEIVDLQDSKLMWDHEKKTLEADVSQYILQCDELMKNNEILLNELENYKRNKLETIHENNEENMLQLESQLEEYTKLNRTLEVEYTELNEKIDSLEQEKQKLTEHLRSVQEDNRNLRSKEMEYHLQLETLELEKSNLVFELNEMESKNDRDVTMQMALNEAEEKWRSAESQLERLSKDHAHLVAAFQAQKNDLLAAVARADQASKTHIEKEAIAKKLQTEVEQLQQRLTGTEATSGHVRAVEEENSVLRQELQAKDIVLENLKEEIRKAQAALSELSEKELQRLSEDEAKKDDSKALAELKDLHEKLAEEHRQLQQTFESQAAELEALRTSVETQEPVADHASLARIALLEAELLGTADLQKSVEALTYEKNEMIKALQQKHSENMQYYMEIQRLQPIIQQLQAAAAEPPKECEKCPTLEAALHELRKEQEKLKDQITFLKEKSDILTTNLLTEQTNQRLVQEQKKEVEEQNVAVRKDLERLRQHLLEIEEMHTQETVEMQRELEGTKEQMVALQDDVSKSSNAYTSASIRANQHAETLQAQYTLVVQQRDDLLTKLSTAEDRESRNQAALVNLQCALEQFQNDKENDIKVATLRIRKELQVELDRQAQLRGEVAAVNQKLNEANQGLQAASRLSDQLDACQRTIASLRDEAERLRQDNSALKEQLSSSESSQSDKIEKNLIKSLLIGYVVSTNPNDKSQVLRMISSVLDFTAVESDKVGLNKQQSSWLGAILGGGSNPQGDHSKENLVQAFVQFLEQESQPKANTENMPTLLNISQGSAGSGPMRRTSVASNSGSGSTSLPPLLNSNVMSDFQPSRNSSSILKDILSDS